MTTSTTVSTVVSLPISHTPELLPLWSTGVNVQILFTTRTHDLARRQLARWGPVSRTVVCLETLRRRHRHSSSALYQAVGYTPGLSRESVLDMWALEVGSWNYGDIARALSTVERAATATVL